MIYITDENTKILTVTSDLETAKLYVKKHSIEHYKFLKELDMKNISRTTFVDGKCIYNNKDFWLNKAPYLFNEYDKHIVKDFLNNDISLTRFKTEWHENCTRLNTIDGIAGQIDYNQQIGKEFIDIFREECILTDFHSITPMEIGQKLANVIVMVQTGSFREAKQLLNLIKETDTDEFLTEERLQKYIDMLDSADVIQYATDENYFYN